MFKYLIIRLNTAILLQATESIDSDCDGVLTVDDCDDSDVNLGSISLDMDCDGVLASDDCNDDNIWKGIFFQKLYFF